MISDVLVKMPYVDGELPVYWWDSEADRCMVIGIFRHGVCLCLYVLSVDDLSFLISPICSDNVMHITSILMAVFADEPGFPVSLFFTISVEQQYVTCTLTGTVRHLVPCLHSIVQVKMVSEHREG